MDLVINKATENEADIVALLARVTFNDSMGNLFVNKEELFNYYEKEFSIEKIKNDIKDHNNIFWIARHKGLPVGYLKLQIKSTLNICSNNFASEINRVFILRDFINKGVGNELHNVMMEELNNLPTEFLWIPIMEDNIPAKNFYEKIGFEKKIKYLYSISRYDLTFDIYVKKIK